ncbi:MAG: T9SS type A sorting domain-containing protein [bacterium]
MKKCVYLVVILISLGPLNAQNERFNWNSYGYRGADFSTVSYNPVDNKLYAIGEVYKNSTINGIYYLFISSDSAKSWVPRNRFTYNDWGIENLKINSKGWLFFTAGYGRKFCRSFDGNYYFTVLDNLYANEIINYKFNSKDDIYAIRSNNKIYFSSDDGLTWTSYDTEYGLMHMNLDSDDDLILTTTINSKIEENYETWEEKLKSSYNELYKFNRLTNSSELIISSYDSDSSKKIFICSTSDKENIYVLGAYDHLYYDGDMLYERWYERPFILIINKSDKSIRQKILDSLDHINSWNRADNLEVNNENNILLYWGDKIYSIDTNFIKIEEGFNASLRQPVEFQTNKNNKFVILNGYYNIIFSTNNGKNWIESYPPVKYHYPFTLVHSKKDSTFIAVDTSNRIYSTKNEGLIWNDITYNIDSNNTVTCINNMQNEQLIIGTKKKGIFLLDSNKTWINCSGDIKNFSIKSICIGDSNLIFIATDSTLYLTSDYFKNFKVITNLSVREMTFFKDCLYIVTSKGELLQWFAKDKNILEIEELTKHHVTSIACNSKNVMIAGTLRSGVWKSTNYGVTWFPSNSEFYSPKVYKIVSTNNDDFIALAESGIFYSNNNGQMWEKNHYPDLNYDSPLYNIYNTYNLISLNNKKVFLFNTSYSSYINCDSIDQSEIEPLSGWIGKGGYFEQKYKSVDKFLKYSKDGKYVLTWGDYPYSGDIFFRKWDNFSGTLIYEKFLPIIHYKLTYFRCLDINDIGTIAIIEKHTYYHDTIDTNEIIIYDIMNEKVINTLNPNTNTNKFCFCNFEFDSDNSIIMSLNCYDKTKEIGDTCGFGGLQSIDLHGNVINKILDKGISNFKLSSDRAYVYYTDFDFIKTDSNRYKGITKSSNIYNIDKKINYKNDTIRINSNYSPIFSENNKFMMFYDGGYPKDYFYFTDLSELFENSPIYFKKIKRLDSSSIEFLFVDSSNVIFQKLLYNYGHDNYDYQLIKMNLEDTLITQKSHFNFPLPRSMKLSPDKKEIIIYYTINTERNMVKLNLLWDDINGINDNISLTYYDGISIFPNPFSESTKFKFYLAQPANVNLTIFNSLGQEIAVLCDEGKPEGEHEINFNGNNLNSGIYYYKFSVGSENHFGKVVLIR